MAAFSKAYLAGLLAVLTGAAVLAGCGKKDDTREALQVGGLPVTCNLTLPVAPTMNRRRV